METKKHNILGNYCWTCKKKTSSRIPGWYRNSSSDGPKTFGFEDQVVWADGSRDSNKGCGHCLMQNCQYPVLDEKISGSGDGYKEVVTSKKYWTWVNENCPTDPETGLKVELGSANPDSIAAR